METAQLTAVPRCYGTAPKFSIGKTLIGVGVLDVLAVAQWAVPVFSGRGNAAWGDYCSRGIPTNAEMGAPHEEFVTGLNQLSLTQ